MPKKYFLYISLLLLLRTTSAYSEIVKLHIPIVSESPLQHLFFHELLTKSLTEIGHTPELIIKDIPQKRIMKELNSGELSLFWMIESGERNKKYIPIKVDITNKLISKRVLLIRHGEQAMYDNVKTLEDFRNLNLVAGMGKNWFDCKVWQANDLPYMEKEGNWKSIFKMVERAHDYNYFPRGINEILTESQQYPELDIEQNLVFIYDRYFLFYLSKKGINAGKPYQKILTNALQKAQESGLLERLIEKYWGNNFKALNYEKRIKIHLKI